MSYLYDDGGKEYNKETYTSDGSYRLSGANTSEEFDRIMHALESKGWITYTREQSFKYAWSTIYKDVLLTEAGLKEVEKTLPQIPLYGLFTQEITTGDQVVDEKINHAKRLFFSEPPTMDNMRSACEALSFVLEPLRKDLKTVIADADVEHFFQLVNKFDRLYQNASASRTA